MPVYLNVAAIRMCTESEGPGKRFALWVQGCKQKCPGCCNSQMQEIKPAHIVEVHDLFHLILKSQKNYGIEGITFLGGEPLLQSEGIGMIAEFCKQNSLTVLLFTGYIYDNLKQLKDKNLARLFSNTDIIVDGVYDKNQPDEERDWVGSKNQNVIFLTESYKKGIEFKKSQRSFEIKISESEFSVNGWPFFNFT